MAKLKIFTVYDAKAEAYLSPFFLPTTGLALRGFADVANEPNHQFNKYPSDYTLNEIGTYEESTAQITMHANKINLGTALEHKTIQQHQNIPNIPQEQYSEQPQQ